MGHTRRKKQSAGKKCDSGFRWDAKQQKCIPLAEFRATRHHRRCANGFRWDPVLEYCVPKAAIATTGVEPPPKKTTKSKKKDTIVAVAAPLPDPEPVVEEKEHIVEEKEPVAEGKEPEPAEPVVEQEQRPVIEDPNPTGIEMDTFKSIQFSRNRNSYSY